MEVYYQDEYSTLYLGDCLPVLAEMPKESVGVIVTDPPYGVEWQSNRRAVAFEAIANDAPTDRAFVSVVMEHCVRVVDQGRHLYVFGPQDVLDDLKVSSITELIWNKGVMGSGNLASPWGPSHERINFTVSKFRHAGQKGADCLPVRLRKGSVLNFNRPTGRNVRHPSEKPVGLLRELIESSSKQGEIVLDPFAGVGSTGVAATLAGRRSILVELVEEYAEIAAKRLAAAASLARQAVAA